MRFLYGRPLDGTQAYVLAAIEHATRRIRILGVVAVLSLYCCDQLRTLAAPE